MDTRSVIVSAITDGEFGDIHKQWYQRRNRDSRLGVLRIENPIHAADYRSLVNEFRTHPKSERISVNYKGVWVKVQKSEWSDEKLQDIVQIAENDSVKKGHLELLIGKGYPHECLKLKFAETDQGIVAYEMSIPLKYTSEVTWKGEQPLGRMGFVGLWNRPESCKLLGSVHPQDSINYI